MIKKLWQLLMLFLALGLDDDTPPAGDDTPPPSGDDETPPAGDDDATPPDEHAGDDDLESLIETKTPEQIAAEKTTRRNDEIRRLREERQAERDARVRAEAERDAERRARQGAAVDQEARTRAEEDAVIERERAAGATKERLEQLEYWRNEQRDRRETKRLAQEARNMTADMADRTDFESIRRKDPKGFDRLASRVEDELAKARAQGNNPPRRAIYYILLGQETEAARERAMKKKPASTDEQRRSATVDRNDRARPRTDVAARQRTNESQKRRERLKTTYI